jgi:hypothetical protein
MAIYLPTGTRVLVLDREHQTPLGEAICLGEVTTYQLITRGARAELNNPESAPDLDGLPSGTTVRVQPDSPKLQMVSDGQIVYGHQVWWKRL